VLTIQQHSVKRNALVSQSATQQPMLKVSMPAQKQRLSQASLLVHALLLVMSTTKALAALQLPT